MCGIGGSEAASEHDDAHDENCGAIHTYYFNIMTNIVWAAQHA
jgi:hypothetical protein